MTVEFQKERRTAAIDLDTPVQRAGERAAVTKVMAVSKSGVGDGSLKNSSNWENLEFSLPGMVII